MRLERVMQISVDVDPLVELGRAPAGEIRVVPFGGGRFEGLGCKGRLLPGGSDWQRVRDNGTLEIRAHYMLESEQGERIEVVSEGLRAAPPAVLQQLAAGEAVAPDAYYFRTVIQLTTAAERLLDINDRLYIGSGEREARRVTITVYQVP